MRTIVLVLALLLTGCGEVVGPTAEAMAAEGARLAAEGRFVEAADRYGQAFALEDPVPERQGVRAELAGLRADMLEQAGYHLDARAWRRQAERLGR